MYQKYFQGIPTKPILAIAPLVVIIVLGLYYSSQYKRCTAQAELRHQLYTYVKKSVNQTISLAEALHIEWDKAFVLPNYKPDHKIRSCPFGWDWSEKYRNKLIAEDSLNVIFYTLDKKRVSHVEFSDQKISFEGVHAETALTTETALFNVVLKNASNQSLLLKRVEPE